MVHFLILVLTCLAVPPAQAASVNVSTEAALRSAIFAADDGGANTAINTKDLITQVQFQLKF